MKHVLNNWKQYLSEEDFNYLINYVENSKNNLPNNKLLVLFGNGSNGKSTLINEIANYIGNENFTLCDTNGSAFFEPIVKLTHIPAIDEYKKKYVQLLKNVIQHGQSVIADTDGIEKINEHLLPDIKIIKMEHKFV